MPTIFHGKEILLDEPIFSRLILDLFSFGDFKDRFDIYELIGRTIQKENGNPPQSKVYYILLYVVFLRCSLRARRTKRRKPRSQKKKVRSVGTSCVGFDDDSYNDNTASKFLLRSYL